MEISNYFSVRTGKWYDDKDAHKKDSRGKDINLNALLLVHSWNYATYDLSVNEISKITLLSNIGKVFDEYGLPKYSNDTPMSKERIGYYPCLRTGEWYSCEIHRNKANRVLNSVNVEMLDYFYDMYANLKIHSLNSLSEMLGLNVSRILKRHNYELFGHEFTTAIQQRRLKKSNIEKYGVENVFQLDSVKEKSKSTCLDKYGVDNYGKSESHSTNLKRLYNTDVGKMILIDRNNKSIKTLMSKYGVENVFQLDSVKEKSKSTCLDKYGVDNYGKSKLSSIEKSNYHIANKDILNELRKQAHLRQYGVENYSMTDEFKNKINKISLEKKRKVCENAGIKDITDNELSKLGYHKSMTVNDINMLTGRSEFDISVLTNFVSSKHRCKVLRKAGLESHINSNQSNEEIIIQKVLDSLGVEYTTNDRSIITPKELDIYIPSHNLAIEVNGVYWHSDKFIDNKYHYDKYKACKSKGITLYQYTDEQINNKLDIIKSMLSSKLGLINKRLYARKLKVAECEANHIKDFLNENHIQGSCGFSYNLALMLDSEIYAVMTFTKYDINTVTLSRFCVKQNCSVAGGFTRLLKHYRRNNNHKIISFSDNMYSDGGVYENNRFKLVNEISPDYRYVKGGVSYHKFGFRKAGIKTKLPEYYNDDLTEREMMVNAGYSRFYNAGLKKWEMV